jgi:hypothetical protein
MRFRAARGAGFPRRSRLQRTDRQGTGAACTPPPPSTLHPCPRPLPSPMPTPQHPTPNHPHLTHTSCTSSAHAAQFFAVLQRVAGAKACRRAKRHAVAQLREVAALINSGRWSTFGDVVADLERRDIYTTKPTPQEMTTMYQVGIRREQKKNGFCGPDPAWMAPAFWMTPAFQREAACGLPVAGLRLFAGVDGNYHPRHPALQQHETAQREALGNTGSGSESRV